MTVRWIATPALAAAALLLVACSSPVKLSETPVENRTPTPVAGAAQPGTPVQPPAATTTPTTQSAVATVTTGTGAAATAAALAWPAQRVVYFDFDSFALREDAKPVIDGHAKVLAANRGRKLTIEGHTDERGGREYNLALGQKRAEAVQRALALLGVNDAQLEAVSFGKEKPAASGSGEDAWARNRRAELKDKP